MKKNLTPFEQSLKNKLDQFEMPYEQSAWVALQRQAVMARTGNSVWIVSLISTILVLSAAATAIYRHRHVPSTAQRAVKETRFEHGMHIITQGISHGSLPINNATIENMDANQLSSNPGYLISLADESMTGANLTSEISPAASESMVKVADNASILGVAVKKPDNVIGFDCNVRRACQGEEVEFQTTSGPKTGSYLWNFGDGHFSDQVNPKHKFAKAGHYDVSLSITGDNGQINTTVVNDMITIEAAPDADFTWEFINSDPATPEVRIINLSEGGNNYEWSNGSQSVVGGQGATFKLKTGGRQMIALNASNEAGCSDGAVKHIAVNTDFTLDAPQSWSFSKGVFMPAGLKKNKVDFQLTVLDSNGKKVYQTNSRTKGWDGKLPDGRSVAPGEMYSYMVIITNDLTQEQKYFNGILTVSP